MIANEEADEMAFCLDGPIDPVRHFHVDREREIMNIAHLVETD